MPQRRNEVRVSGSGSLRRYAMCRGPLNERAGIAMHGGKAATQSPLRSRARGGGCDGWR